MKPRKTAVKGTVLLGISASIAAYRVCDLIRAMRHNGIRVIPVLSRDAHHFVTPLTLQALSQEPVYQDMFDVAQRSKPEHIGLAQAADVILLAPATADLLARVSLGLADDLLASVVLSSVCPIVAAPAMNDKMYAHPATQEHLGRLRKRGFRFVGPIKGDLVCQTVGEGHIASTEDILKTVMEILTCKPHGVKKT